MAAVINFFQQKYQTSQRWDDPFNAVELSATFRRAVYCTGFDINHGLMAQGHKQLLCVATRYPMEVVPCGHRTASLHQRNISVTFPQTSLQFHKHPKWFALQHTTTCYNTLQHATRATTCYKCYNMLHVLQHATTYYNMLQPATTCYTCYNMLQKQNSDCSMMTMLLIQCTPKSGVAFFGVCVWECCVFVSL